MTKKPISIWTVSIQEHIYEGHAQPLELTKPHTRHPPIVCKSFHANDYTSFHANDYTSFHANDYTSFHANNYTGRLLVFNPNQVRSIAAEAAFAASGAGSTVQLEWYTMDFNEEWSAMDGMLLEQQAEFALRCVQHLSTLYHK
eukprot:gene25157-30702_t